MTFFILRAQYDYFFKKSNEKVFNLKISQKRIFGVGIPLCAKDCGMAKKKEGKKGKILAIPAKKAAPKTRSRE